MNPLVSLVVTTKNEEMNIENCLRSLAEQTYSNTEIIVIDNYSTDKTKNLSFRFTSLVFDKGPERSAQRNEGMLRIAKGKYCCYFDADMLASKYLIEDAVDQLELGIEIGLYVREVVLGNSLFAKVRRFERQFYDATVIDAARIFRRDSFIQSGGFSEEIFQSGSGEDWDLDKSIRLHGKLGMLTSKESKNSSRRENEWLLDLASNLGVSLPKTFNGILHNEGTDSLFSYLKKKTYYARGFQGYINKWGKNDKDIRLQFGLRYRLFIVFLEDQKWKKVLRQPMLFVGVFCLKVLIGLVTFRKFKKFPGY